MYYTVVRKYETDPGSIDEAVRTIRDEFVPRISKIRGFISYYVVKSERPGRGIVTSVNVFEDRAGADESTRIEADLVHQHLASHLPTPPEVISGEVVVQHVKAGIR